MVLIEFHGGSVIELVKKTVDLVKFFYGGNKLRWWSAVKNRGSLVERRWWTGKAAIVLMKIKAVYYQIPSNVDLMDSFQFSLSCSIKSFRQYKINGSILDN